VPVNSRVMLPGGAPWSWLPFNELDVPFHLQLCR
jgi:hypothetical protein